MPFICTLTEENCHAEVFTSGEEHTVIVHVGYDGTGDKTYSIVVGLSPQPPGEQEYFFALIEADAETEMERRIYDDREISGLIEKEDRKKILAAIIGATELLLNVVKPERFIMCTYVGDLPRKALEKYFRLNQLFIEAGYVVTRADPYHGRYSWWMERQS